MADESLGNSKYSEKELDYLSEINNDSAKPGIVINHD
jgi:hypothetical protein